MATNTFLTPQMITEDALRVLKNQLKFTNLVDRRYEDQFARDGGKIGSFLDVRKPPRYTIRKGAPISIQDTTEEKVRITVTEQAGVDIGDFTSADLALTMDRFRERYINPAIVTIANQIDYEGLLLYKQVYSTVGSVGTVPNDSEIYLSAKQKMLDLGCPDDEINVVISPNMEKKAVKTFQGLFNPQDQRSSAWRKGAMIGSQLGLEWYRSQNVPRHTIGALGGTPLTNGATSSGATTIVTDGWTASAAILKAGDVIQLAGVYSVNPQNRTANVDLQDFTVTADVTANGSGQATIPISPAIITTGAFKTVNAAPADNAAISVFGVAAASQSTISSALATMGMAFHRDAFTLVVVDLPLPKGADMAARASDKDLGLSIRLVRDWSVETDKWTTRLDVLYGWACLRPELACRIIGS